MKSKAKTGDHKAQPNLVVFPLGPVITAMIFDGINLFKDSLEIVQLSYWTMTLGLIASLVVTIFAWADWFAIPTLIQAKRISMLPAAVNMLAFALLGVSWFWHKEDIGSQPSILSLACLGQAFVLLSLTGWWDGEWVDRSKKTTPINYLNVSVS